MLNQIIKIEVSANAVAWYGAIIATVALLLSGLKLWQERLRIKISIYKDQEIWGENEIGHVANLEPGKIFWHMFISNIGRQKIIIDQIGVNYKNKKGGAVIRKDYNGIIDRFELVPQNSRSFLISEELLSLKNIKKIQVKDATGRIWEKNVC